MTGCSCERYQLTAPDGSLLEGERRRDPDCREHGLPKDGWPAGHPLRRHMRYVNVETGEVVPYEQTRRLVQIPDPDGAGRVLYDNQSAGRFREETARETEARLYRESRAA